MSEETKAGPVVQPMTRLVAVFTRWWILLPASALILIAAVKGVL